MSDTLTARAARWCEAAGIPPPDFICPVESSGSFALHWTGRFSAHCRPDGTIWWHDYCRNRRDSASLIAAIKEAMNE